MSVVPTSLKLFTNNASPYALKVMLYARELGLYDRLTLDSTSVAPSPLLTTTSHSALVPNGKIPALLVDDKTPIFGSACITQYLAYLANVQIGGEGIKRFEALTTESIADSIMEATLLVRYERLVRPATALWPEWVTGQISKVSRSVPILAQRLQPLPQDEKTPLGLESVATYVALWYIDKRAGDLVKWRSLEGGDKLEAWYAQVTERPAFKSQTFG